jgi:hypothetical protein
VIIGCADHGSLWDGEQTLLDFNYPAMEVPPDDCLANAFEDELEPGELSEVGFAEHYTMDVARAAKQRQEAGLRPLEYGELIGD